MCSPGASSTTDGVLPTKLPSISISAPSGVEATLTLGIDALLLGGSAAGATAGEGAAGLATAARICDAWADQSFTIPSHASWTEPPSDSVEWLTTTSPETF